MIESVLTAVSALQVCPTIIPIRKTIVRFLIICIILPLKVRKHLSSYNSHCRKAAEAIDFYVEQLPNSVIEITQMYAPSAKYPKAVKHAVITWPNYNKHLTPSLYDSTFSLPRSTSCKAALHFINML